MLPYLKDRSCPKCAQSDVSTQYRASGESGNYGSPGWSDSFIRDAERLDRYCRNCSYQWAERVVTAKEKAGRGE